MYCHNYESCITRRVILKKRKMTVRTTPTDELSKRPNIEGQVPPVPLPDRVEEESTRRIQMFRCLSFFYFFIPTGCSFNIFCIFGRRDVLPFLHQRTRLFVLKTAQAGFCLDFQTGDSPNQPHPADPATVPLLSGTQSSGSTTTLTECPNHGAYEPGNRSESYTQYFKQDVTEVVTGKMHSGGAIMDPTHHLIGDKDAHGTAENGSFPSDAIYTPDFKVDSPIVTNITQDHVVAPVFGGVIQVAPRLQQRDDRDILKAIGYRGLVESVTSLSVASAAASSGAKTLDIFILGIANLTDHNIADLRDIRDVDGNDEQVGHYWLQLGRRPKARLHMVMALLSCVVFGLLPLVLCGLSFHESNDRENKMMAVTGGPRKGARPQNSQEARTYFKTLVYYLTIAVSSSGLLYVASVLITGLLVRYGIIEEQGGASAPPGLSFPPSGGAQTSAWASF